eukprot:5745715-Prymnesium_polylepis.1
MPTAVAKKLLDACKAEAEAKPKLYRVTVTRVTAVAWIQHCGEEGGDEPEVKMQHRTQTLLLEASDDLQDKYKCVINMMDYGKMFARWLNAELPFKIERDNELTIVHSITPYIHKRSRE